MSNGVHWMDKKFLPKLNDTARKFWFTIAQQEEVLVKNLRLTKNLPWAFGHCEQIATC